MRYWVDLFSPTTYEIFTQTSRTISGFRATQEHKAKRVQVGDIFVCYMTKLSRWIGLLKVESEYFIDTTPIYSQDDPFIVRFRVKPLVWLPKEATIPIHDDVVWNNLSFTRGHDKGSSLWTGQVRGSLNELSATDGRFLEELLTEQARRLHPYPFDEREYQKHLTRPVRGSSKTVDVTVPENAEDETAVAPVIQDEVRESIKMQALLAHIGQKMGMKIWIPKADRSRVLSEWKGGESALLDTLPLNYDETTIKTIEQIDVLWLRGRAIARAFEVEHTTSVYSGLLRMADLLALQPNMDIKLHIVAPASRQDKVFQEIRRPVFSLLERGPLYESCTFLSYESVRELANERHLSHMSDSVIDDEYAQVAE